MHFLHFLKFYRQTKIKMKDEITEFFGNLENITDFLITKWIYEQTNDLKPYLFCQLNKAFNRYCVDWLENKRNNQTKYDFPQVYNGQIRDFLTTPGLFETSIIADSAIKKDIVLNHYSFYENIIEFESQPQPMKGLFSVWDSVLYSEVYRFQNIMHKLFEEIKSKEPTAQPQEPEAVNPDEKYKTENLFKVGLLFATGKMNEYFTINSSNKEFASKNQLSPKKIAIELGNPSFEKWILATKNNYPKDNKNASKNIFNNKDMMINIIDHCEALNIQVEPYFKNRLPIE